MSLMLISMSGPWLDWAASLFTHRRHPLSIGQCCPPNQNPFMHSSQVLVRKSISSVIPANAPRHETWCKLLHHSEGLQCRVRILAWQCGWWMLLAGLIASLGNQTLPAQSQPWHNLVAENWKAPYVGPDSNGPHVLGHWNFDGDDPTSDRGPSQLPGKLDGAVANPRGRFGRGLESFAGHPHADKHHALVVGPHPSLSPVGAFTLEMWVHPTAEFPNASLVYLLDKKYASHSDYQWQLLPPTANGSRSMVVHLGFGKDSESFATEPLSFPVDTWQHLAITYDGRGTVRFFKNGSSVGNVTRLGRLGIESGPLPLCIGDRTGSHYGGFPGVLDEVRLTTGAREFSPARISFDISRRAWVRREPAPSVKITISNLLEQPLERGVLVWRVPGQPAEKIELPLIPPRETHVLGRLFDTALRPDIYDLRARLEIPGEDPVVLEDQLLLTLVGRPLPDQFPVLMWGIGSAGEFSRELPRLQRLGFTHALGMSADVGAVWKAQSPVAPPSSDAAFQANRQMLDLALANRFGIAAQLYPGYFLKQQPDLRRVNREGQPLARTDANASLPGLLEFCENVGSSLARTYGDHPALVAALVNSEVRDDAEISFSSADLAAARRALGFEIPDLVTTKWGVPWKSVPDFPADRVIPANHPILRFYRWFWSEGDGWNGLHSAVHRGLKSTGRDDLWTWYDPAIRVPSVPGSGGDVDVLSQWTYTEPSPLRVGYFADELLAMARAAPGRPRRIMKMTQLFWYRSTSAPLKMGKEYIASPFDDHDPDAAYISLAPMHLRESFWSKISRQVSGLMYHGWSSLVPTDGTHPYKYTQPDLQTEFSRLHTKVLPPLAPLLTQLQDRPADVAYINSFAAQVFARRGSYGYSHDEAFLTLLHAQLQPEVVFDERLPEGGLDRFRILVLMDCDVLTEQLVAEVRKFQARGGVVIADPNLAPAIRPDILLPRFVRTKQTAADKTALLANAQKLRIQLDSRYSRYAESDNPELITRVRSAGQSDYVFLVNDRREFGTYVGQHGLVMEQGLPSEALVTLRRPHGYIYDLLTNQPVEVTEAAGELRWRAAIGPCDGGLFLVAPQPVTRVVVEMPESARVGDRVPVMVQVLDAIGRPVAASIPLSLEVTDPNGRPAEISGQYATKDGSLAVELDLAQNDQPGTWTVRAREWATGRVATAPIRVHTSVTPAAQP